MPVTVNPAPEVPTITQAENILASSSPTDNQWYFNGTPIPGATGQFHTATQSGFYQVEVTNIYGCSSISALLNVIISNVSNENPAHRILIYPNPSSGSFTLEINGLSGQDIELSIKNMIGQDIYNTKFNQQNEKIRKHIDLTKYPKGIYVLEIITERFMSNKKIIIEQ